LSVENSKSPFRHLAAQNGARDVLIVATSFPTRAVRLLLNKLPPELPHSHFGDTDPAGYFILLKLRECSPRPVAAWHMDWCGKTGSPPLSPYDRRVLDQLLPSPLMADIRDDLRRMLADGQKGDFEQETRVVSLSPCGPAGAETGGQAGS